MYVPKWVLLIPVLGIVALFAREYPALVRYLKIERM